MHVEVGRKHLSIEDVNSVSSGSSVFLCEDAEFQERITESQNFLRSCFENGKKVFLRDVDSFKLSKNKANNALQKNVPGLKKAANQAYNNINEQL